MAGDKFLVWNPENGYPKTFHMDKESAIAESERLAQLHPGQRFFVMAPVGVSVVAKTKIFSPSNLWHYTPF